MKKIAVTLEVAIETRAMDWSATPNLKERQ